MIPRLSNSLAKGAPTDYDAAYESAVNAVTSEAVVELVKAIMAQGNFIQISLSPAQ